MPEKCRVGEYVIWNDNLFIDSMMCMISPTGKFTCKLHRMW